MAGLGQIFVELDLDFSKFEKNQYKLLQSAKEASTSVEKNWQNLGVKSDNIFNAMRASAENSYNMIKNHAGSSTAEIARAHAAMNAKIQAANREQFGTHESMLSKFKSNWLAVTAAVTAAIMIMRKAWNLAEEYNEYAEMKVGLQALAMQYGVTAEAMIQMTKAASGMQLSMKEAGEMSARALTTGLNPQQIATFTEQAERLTGTLGGKMVDAFAAMEEAAGSGNSKALRQYKIYIDLNDVVKEYAAKHKMLASEIDQTTLVQIRENAIMEVARLNIEKMGPAMDSAAASMNKLKATWADIRLIIGEWLTKAAFGATAAFQWLAAGILSAYGYALKLWVKMHEFQAYLLSLVGLKNKNEEELLAESKDNMNAAFGAAEELTGKAAKNWDAMSTVGKDINNTVLPVMKEKTAAVTEASIQLKNSWEKTKQSLSQQTERGGISDEFQRRIYDVQTRAKDLQEEYKKISGASIDIKRWEAVEIANIEQESRFVDIEAVRKGNEEKQKESEKMLEKFFKDEEAVKEKRIKEARETSEELIRISRERLEAIKKDEDYHYQARADQYKIFQDFMNQAGGGELAGNLAFLASASKGEDQYTQEIERANQHYVEMLAMNQGYWDATTRNAEAAAQRDAQIEQSKANRTLSTTSSMLGVMAGLAKAYNAASGQENSKALKVYKAITKAQIVVDTIKAAMSAYAAMSGIFPAPLWGVLAAAAAVMYGKAQLDQVDSANEGAAAVSASGGGGGGGASYGSSISTTPEFKEEPKKEEAKKGPEVHVYFYGDVLDHDKLARDLIPGINKALEDKVQ